MDNASIRMAAVDDAGDILSIYAPYVEKTAITFEYEVPSLDEFRERVRHTLQSYPYLVCTERERIVGFAYAQRHRERAAYQWNATLSVYLQEQCTGHGIGKALYHALIETLRLQNIRNVYAGVTIPNAKSQGLHKSLGFHEVGVFRNTGFKGGAWHDVLWYEKALVPLDESPQAVVPIAEVDSALLHEILRSAVYDDKTGLSSAPSPARDMMSRALIKDDL